MSSPRQHTPGPWSAVPYINGKIALEDDQGQGTIALVDTVHTIKDPREQEANARLIASAPELLAALAGCADALREAGKDFAQANKLAARPNLYELHERSARAAIAKATSSPAR